MIYKGLFALVLFSLLLISCEKDTLRGDLIGYVTLKDEFGFTVGNNSGVKASIEGFGNEFEAVSEANGQFVVRNVPQGTYKLLLEKEGYGAKPIYGIQHIGGVSPTIIPPDKNETLYGISKTNVTNLRIQVQPNLVLADVLADISRTAPTSLQLHVNLFFSKSPDVSISNYVTYTDVHADPTNMNGLISLPFLYDAGFRFGDRVYVVAYGGGHYTYYDPILNKHINSALSPNASNVASFVLP